MYKRQIQQDEPFNMQLYPKLEKVYICPKIYYHYVIYVKENAGSKYLKNKDKVITDVYHKFIEFYKEWNLDDNRVWKYINHRYVNGIFEVVTETYFHKDCQLSKQQRYRRIDRVIHAEELIKALKISEMKYEKNPINNLQKWSFNHRKTKLLIWSTVVKKWLKGEVNGI